MKKLFFILTTIFLFSCIEREKVPASYIKPEVIVSMFADIHLAEHYLYKKGENHDSSRKIFHHVYLPLILEKHNIDSAEYERNIDFYTKNPAILSKVYEQVVDTLQQRSLGAKLPKLNK